MTEKERMLKEAERTLLPILPEFLHPAIKHIEWNEQGLFYFNSMAKLRLELKKSGTNWSDFVKTSKDIDPMEFAAKCIYDPYTRFLLEDVDGFKDWLLNLGVVKGKHVDLLFDHRLISSDKKEFDAIVEEINRLKTQQ